MIKFRLTFQGKLVEHKIFSFETAIRWTAAVKMLFAGQNRAQCETISTRVRFELTRAEHNRLAICRLNRSATSSQKER